MADLFASWQISAAGHPSSPVCFGDRAQPNTVGDRNLWREHGAKSEDAFPDHVEPLQAQIKRWQAEYDAPSIHCLDVPSHCDLRDGGVDVAPR